MAFMLARVIKFSPVNPNPAVIEIQGQKVTHLSRHRPADRYGSGLRRSEALYEVAEEAIAIQVKILWAQLGVVDEAAAELAQGAGLTVVMDRCPKIELARAASNLVLKSGAEGICTSPSTIPKA